MSGDVLSAIRLESHTGVDLLTARCLQPGCEWTMMFSWGAQRLSVIIDVCQDHPCLIGAKPEDDPIRQVGA